MEYKRRYQFFQFVSFEEKGVVDTPVFKRPVSSMIDSIMDVVGFIHD